jgi:hypothetical protein
VTDGTTTLRERRLGPEVAGIGTASFLAGVGHKIATALLPDLLIATFGALALSGSSRPGAAAAPF